MERNHQTRGIILKSWPVGEIHSSVRILTMDRGSILAMAHGTRSRRGQLRGLCEPLNQGMFWLYHDPSRDSWKITDADLDSLASGIKGRLDRYLIACTLLDLAGKVPDAGVEEYHLLKAALDCLEGGDLADPLVVLLQFLDRFVEYHGIATDADRDAESGRAVDPGSWVAFSPSRGGFVQAPAAGTGHSPGMRSYVRHTRSLDLPEAVRIHPPPGAVLPWVSDLVRYVADHFDVRLSSWEIFVTMYPL